MKTLSIVTPSPSVISAGFIIEHKDFPLSIIPSVYNPHFFKICIVPKRCDYRQGSTVQTKQKKVHQNRLETSEDMNFLNSETNRGKQYQFATFVLHLPYYKCANGFILNFKCILRKINCQ